VKIMPKFCRDKRGFVHVRIYEGLPLLAIILILLAVLIPRCVSYRERSKFIQAVEQEDVAQVARCLHDLGQGRRTDLLNHPRGDGLLPLQIAVSTGNPDLVNLLLTSGAEVNARSAKGDTALMRAAAEGKAGIVELLLQRGADPTIKDNNGETVGVRGQQVNP
jgi:ankyrin repeat protein